MKYFFVLLLPVLLIQPARAQQHIPETVQELHQMETQMQPYADAILNASETVDRAIADSFFTRALVRALQVPYSFAYPFDSLKTISFLYAPDSSFRIITWQVMKDFTYYRKKGAIQMHTDDGSLKLIPLFDFTGFSRNPVDSVRSNREWIGAVYYKIIEKTYNNQPYYTLFGYDENDARSTKKWVEVLHFDANKQPLFGGRFFNYPNDPMKAPQPAYRFCLEFKKNANAHLNYDPDLDMITFAHLTSETGEPDKKYTLVPMGSYEGFRWVGGKWVYVPVVKQVDPNASLNPTPESIEQRRNNFVLPKKKRGGN